MAQKSCKIDRAGLSEFVQELVANGVTTRAKVAQKIRDHHPSLTISEATVGRYLNKLKASAGSKAFQIISDHVDKVVPEDLKALEAMESLAYRWAMEAAKPQAQRLADATVAIDDEMEEWISLFRNVDDRTKLIKQIILKCLGYVQEDAREQAARLAAMNAAVKIISLKLDKAGLLDNEAKGRIIIMTKPPEAETDPGKPDGRIRLVHHRIGETS